MKEICIVNKGENIKKLNYRLGIKEDLKLEEGCIFEKNFVVVKDGSDDIQIVRNYNPYFISKSLDCDKLKNKGYKIVAECGESVIYYYPSSIIYTVKPLESIEDIADKLGVDVGTLMSSNNLNTKKLFIGQKLYI